MAGGGRAFFLLVAAALALLGALGLAVSPAPAWRGALLPGADAGPEQAAAASQAEQPLALGTTLGAGLTDSGAAAPAVPERAALAGGLPSIPLAPPRALLPSPLEGVQVVSYYGTPDTPEMGILGAHEPARVADLVVAHARRYDELNGPLGVRPAFHLVYAVAQDQPTPNERYLRHVGETALAEYVSLARERGFLLVLDLQIGRSTVERELRRIAPYLRLPFVHVALDPEFAVGPDEVPGQDIGSLDAADINQAQQMLQAIVVRERLPPKILIVHQFLDSMVTGADVIERYPGVELVIDMDGFGPAAVKKAKYGRFASGGYAERAGIKLFFGYDPDLMSEAEVLDLRPRPVVVIYQ